MGQGCVLGPLKCDAALGVIMRQVLAHLGPAADCVTHCWIMDDGQFFMPPDLVDPFLHILEEESNAMGATRIPLDRRDCKTVVRLLGSPCGEDPSWATDYVRDTCRVLPGSANPKILGVGPGVWDRAVTKAALLHERIGIAEDPGTELVLT